MYLMHNQSPVTDCHLTFGAWLSLSVTPCVRPTRQHVTLGTRIRSFKPGSASLDGHALQLRRKDEHANCYIQRGTWTADPGARVR